MKSKERNIEAIRKVAKALDDLNRRVVFVGGAVVSLYSDDPGAGDVRPTMDVDISLEITSLGALEQLRKELSEKGFHQNPDDDVICRFRYQDILVDIMATRNVGWAPANPWYEPGFNHLELVQLNDLTIRILSLPYYIASKYDAFNNRGSIDPRTSHDLEDITYVLDNRDDLVEQIKMAPKDVKDYLLSAFSEILTDQKVREAVMGHLEYVHQTERFRKIEEKLKRILEE